LRVPAPLAFAQSVAGQIDGGTLTQDQFIQQLVGIAQNSTIPALSVQDFFFGASPSSPGLDFLTNFANTIQTPAGGGFSLQNTYVNMAATDAINPSSSFAASFGLAAVP